MASVEGAVPAQVPGSNQYWEHIKSKDRAYFIGRYPDGRMVWQCEGDGIEVGNLDWSGWRHIPGCTGWDWEPEKEDEFPQYYVGTQWADGTAYVVRWGETHAKGVGRSGAVFGYAWDDIAKRFVERGTLVRVTEAEAMARLDKPAAEEYPQYWTSPAVGSTAAFVKRISKTECVTVMPSGTYGPMLNWEHSFPEQRTRLTEQEALALLDKPADRWPKYYVNRDPGLKWYVRAENHRDLPDVYLPDGSAGTSQANWDDIDDSLRRGVWLEVTEAEARARIAVAAEPRIDVQFLPVAPEMDWVVQDRVPARNNVDEWCWCKRGRSPGHFYSGFGGWSGTIMHGHRMGDEVLHMRCRRKDLPEITPEMEWVDITDRDQLLRIDIDQVYRCVDTFGYPIGWEFVRVPGLTLNKASSDLSAARCRRKDLPVVESPEEWVELPQDHEMRRGIDWIQMSPGDWHLVDGYHGCEVGSMPATLRACRCRRKDLPKIESPEDWVTQDRVEARPRIDQAWWAYDDQTFDTGKWSWWNVDSAGSASGRKHGHRTTDGQILHVRCRRKNLPPVPSPAEETFPQWYILKDDERRSWVPDWTIKRTGKETAIRYARDEAGELYATDEQWTGAAECWQRCSALEAYDRLGTRILPDVPPAPRRVPVKLWVTYRLNDEGGDWPVRATQADQTCQNWKEIKFDGNGAFIEVEQ